jgi:hypothetical protein
LRFLVLVIWAFYADQHNTLIISQPANRPANFGQPGVGLIKTSGLAGIFGACHEG